MNASPTEQPGEHRGHEAPNQPSEEELRAAYEEELSRITSADLALQAAVSLLNIGGRRLGLSTAAGEPADGGRDLEQVRDAIDGVRALLVILERRRPGGYTPVARCAVPVTDGLRARGNDGARNRGVQARQRRAGQRRSLRAPPGSGRGNRVQARAGIPRRGRIDATVQGRLSPVAGCGCPGAEAPLTCSSGRRFAGRNGTCWRER